MRGAKSASTPRLRRSTFSFIRPKISGPQLKPGAIQVDALTETNRILVEIQKQLSLDFANRIIEKEQELRAYRQRITRERASKKEKSIESIGKSGSNIIKVFDKVISPAKSIFQKILDFFSIIATGLIVNNAFKWLEKKENREKLKAFFNFVKDYWKEILIVFGTYKILRLVAGLKRIIDLFKRPPRPPGPGGGGRGGGGKPGGGGGGGCGPVFSCLSKIGGPAAELLAQQLKKTRVFSPLFGLLPRQKPVQRPKDVYGNLPAGVREDLLKGGKTAAPGVDALGFIVAGLIGALAGGGALTTATIGSLWSKLSSIGIRAPKPKPVPVGRTVSVSSTRIQNRVYESLQGRTATARQRISRRKEEFEGVTEEVGVGGKANPNDPQVRSMLEKVYSRKSKGGTIVGRGSGSVDSVPTMLAPGEEVIRTSSANLFRPLLKDINNNAGRMWNTFSTAIRDMVSYNQTTRTALKDLNNNLQIFKKQLDDFINKEKLEKFKKSKGGGYGLKSSQTQSPTLILPTLVVHSDLKKPTRPVTRTTIPITLPTKTSNYKMPAISGGVATEEPDVSSVNLANDYMMLTPKMYGIFV